MALVQQLFVNPQSRVIGFTGGKGRDYLINQLANELSRAGKRVVVTHLKNELLPVTGYIVYDDPENLLVRIESEIDTHPLIYAGREVKDHFITGITMTMARKIAGSKKVDFLLFIVGTMEKYSIYSRNRLNQLGKLALIDQLIYCFQMDWIDQVAGWDMVENYAEFSKEFAAFNNHKILNQKLMVAYLTDREKGANVLFRQGWPSVLVLTDIDNPFLENRAINLARDLSSHQMPFIFMANLKENLIKKIAIT